MSKNGNTTVIYLSWLPYGPGHFEAFLQSYRRHPAGADHELFVIFNGVSDDTQLLPFQQLLQQYQVKARIHTKSIGQDIEAYFEAATAATEAGLLLFLNTYSQLLADNWLFHYQQAFEKDGVGLAGATASWQSYYEVVLRQLKDRPIPGSPPRGSLAFYKLWIKASLYWRWQFKAFPNPHVRSNAFMMRRDDFLRIRHRPFTSKFRAYLFESGLHSMTRQVQQQGYKAVVIDRNGQSYPLDEVKQARIFWSGNQENLLVSDNQTRLYELADNAVKKEMFAQAWCSQAANQSLPKSNAPK